MSGPSVAVAVVLAGVTGLWITVQVHGRNLQRKIETGGDQ